MVVKEIKCLNIVPAIAQSDRLTLEECEAFKVRIRDELSYHSIRLYPFDNEDQDTEELRPNEAIRELSNPSAPPFMQRWANDGTWPPTLEASEIAQLTITRLNVVPTKSLILEDPRCNMRAFRHMKAERRALSDFPKPASLITFASHCAFLLIVYLVKPSSHRLTMASPAETAKVLSICQILNSTPAKMTPKRFMEIFLESPDSEIAYLRRLWAQPIGLPSTMRLMPLLRNEVHRTKGGYDLWSSFIQQEAINILVSQEAPRDTILEALSTAPYLPGVASDAMDDEDAREAANVLEETEEGVSPSVAEEFGEVAYVQSLTGGARRHARNSR
ncbi:hypothetical protein H4Q26_009629, partial [Puccinia striiformis f. sp. tritici PST-130]